jgi:hypothetical protein
VALLASPSRPAGRLLPVPATLLTRPCARSSRRMRLLNWSAMNSCVREASRAQAMGALKVALSAAPFAAPALRSMPDTVDSTQPGAAEGGGGEGSGSGEGSGAAPSHVSTRMTAFPESVTHTVRPSGATAIPRGLLNSGEGAGGASA